VKAPRLARGSWVGAVLVIAITVASCGGKAAEDRSDGGSRQEVDIPFLDRVRSGEIEATLRFYDPGTEDHLDMRLIGTFLGAGGESLPLVDFGAEASGVMGAETVDVNTALIATRDRAVLTYDGDTFETDRHTFEALEASFGGALGRGGPSDVAACLEAAGQIEFARIASQDTPPAESKMVDGTPVRVTSIDLRGLALASVLRRLREDPGCGDQLRAAGSMTRVLEEVEDALESEVGEVEATLALDGKGRMRELSVHVALHSHRKSGAEADLLIRLMQVNEITELPPCHGERPLSALIRKLGFNPLESIEKERAAGLIGLLEGIYGGEGKGALADGRVAPPSAPA